MSIENKKFIDIDMPDIIEWCVENNQLGWLNENNAPKATPIYPMIEYTKKDGTKGKKADKKAAPIKTVEKTPSTVEIKTAFVQKFFPEKFATAGAKAPTKDELIAAAGTPAYAEILKKYKAAQEKAKAAKEKKKAAKAEKAQAE